MTTVVKINPRNIELSKIKRAAKLINNGKIVAFPTETVYGLGADALNPIACAKIFEVKNRPLIDPLIVHIAKKEDIFRLAKAVPRVALRLIKEFFPGPLTLVLKKSKLVPDITTAGLDTVAIRMPQNKIALKLIESSKTPIAAPSANLFGKPSPTSAKHVLEDLNGKIDMVIDGGKTKIGVESTVLDLTSKPYKVLRPGGVTVEELRRVIGKLEVIKRVPKSKIPSPGMFKKHYSIKAKVILVKKSDKQIKKMKELATKFEGKNKKVGLLITSENKNKFKRFKIRLLGSELNLRECAVNLFSALRSFEKEKMNVVIIQGIKPQGLGLAIMDRLQKAADEIIS